MPSSTPLRSLYAFLFLLLPATSALYAQDGPEHLSPFAHGAGRTYSVSTHGLDAIGLNPSLLLFGEPKHIELSLIPITSIGANIGSTFSSLGAIRSALADSALSDTNISANGVTTRGDSTRQATMNYFRNNGLASNVNARLFGISYIDPELGGFALTWDMHVALRASFPDSLFVFLGTNAISQFLQGRLTPHTVDVQAIWYSEYTLSWARHLYGNPFSGDLQLLGGVGIKYLAGIEYLRVDPNSDFSVNYPRQHGGKSSVAANYLIRFAYPDQFAPKGFPDGFSLSYLTAATAGSGVGADIGFTLGAFDSLHHAPWHVALSLTDIGAINWTKHTDTRSANDTISAELKAQSTDTINSYLKALGGKLDTADAPFSSKLPTTLHMAGALDLAEIGLVIPACHLSVATELALGLTDVVGSPNHGRFGFAAMLERPAKGVSFHTALGFTTQDGLSDMTFALGFGFGNTFFLDFGTAGMFNLLKSSGYRDGVLSLKLLL